MKKSFLFLLLGCSFLNAATPIKNISEIAAGGYFILLLKQNKNVLALGDNTYGELGNGESGDDPVENPVTVVSPSKIGVLTNIKSIAGGLIHSLSLSNDGNVYSWGRNNYGQLGDGTTYDSNVPILIESLNSIIAISANNNYSLALKNDGTVWFWGWLQTLDFPSETIKKSKVPIQLTEEMMQYIPKEFFSPKVFY